MPLKAFDTIEEVPESLRDAAIETKDGKFVVSEDEDVSGLKAAAVATRKERDAAKKAERQAAQELAELRAEVEARKSGLSSDELAKIKLQAEDKYRPIVDEAERLKSELRTLRLDSTVKGMLAKADAVDVEDVWKIVGADFDLTDDGKPILKADPTADVEKYVASLRTKKPNLFKGSQAAGGGAAGQQKSGAPGNSKPVTQWTADEKQAYRDANGEDSIGPLLDQYLRDAVKPKAA